MCESCGCGTRGDVMLYESVTIQFNDDAPISLTKLLPRQLASFAYRVQKHQDEYERNWGECEKVFEEVQKRVQERSTRNA